MGLGPGDKGLRQLGDGWLMGDNSALGGFSIPISVVVLKPTAATEKGICGCEIKIWYHFTF